MERKLVIDFDILDAALAAVQHENFKLERKQITAKFVSYAVIFVSGKRVAGLGSFTIRAIAEKSVLVTFYGHPETPREKQADEIDVISSVFDRFTEGILPVSHDSGHFAVAPDARAQMVEKFLRAYNAGRVRNRDTWAQMNLGISYKTLTRYLKQFGQWPLPR